MVAAAMTVERAEGRWFYVWMAGICALVVYGGFAPTYYLQLPGGTFVGTRLLHVHAVVFSLWPLFVVSQSTLAATGRLTAHRAWGLFGVSLVTAMLVLGFATAIQSLAAAMGTPNEETVRRISVLSFTGIILFAVIVAVAIANVRRPETHKRLMLLATISILQAAIARLLFTVAFGFSPGARPGLASAEAFGLAPGAAPPVFAMIPGALVSDVLIVAMIVFDIRSRGRIHPATAIGGAVILAVQLLRGPLTLTPAWRAITDFLAAFAS
jgi:hypothetical protein